MTTGQSGPNDGFGRYLASVAERDIDLLLLEEFHASEEFVRWFCGEIGLHNISPADAWHSVSDADGESDLLVRVIQDGQRIGVFIENKIAAPEQDRQAERYHIRGIKCLEQGKLDGYVTVMCAPKRYLDSLSDKSEYLHHFSYEKIAAWFGTQSGPRAAWRQHVMQEAIEHGRRGYAMEVNAANTAFHSAYWEHLQGHHRRFQMARPKKRGSNSTWIIFQGHDFPKEEQEKKIQRSNLPPAVEKTVVEQSKGATIRGVLAGEGERADVL